MIAGPRKSYSFKSVGQLQEEVRRSVLHGERRMQSGMVQRHGWLVPADGQALRHHVFRRAVRRQGGVREVQAGREVRRVRLRVREQEKFGLWVAAAAVFTN